MRERAGTMRMVGWSECLTLFAPSLAPAPKKREQAVALARARVDETSNERLMLIAQSLSAAQGKRRRAFALACVQVG